MFLELKNEMKEVLKKPILNEKIWGGKVGKNELLRNINRLAITFCISGRFKSEVVMTLNDIYMLMTHKFISPIRTSHCHWDM